MKPFVYRIMFVLSLLTLGFFSSQATTLGLGDIAFTGYNADDPDEFTFVLLKDIDLGTTITFTDKGWFPNNTFNSSEGTLTVTFTSAQTCGDEFRIIDQSGWKFFNRSGGTAGTISEGGSFALSISGDQIFAYQGGAPSSGNASNWIAAIHMNCESGCNATDWDNVPSNTTVSGSPESAKPSIFSSGNYALFGGEQDAGKYGCSITTGDPSALQSAINVPGNWSFSNDRLSTVASFCPTPLSCSATCTAPVINSLTTNSTIGSNTFCPGDAVVITVNGSANDATSWNLYSGSCGGTVVSTIPANSSTFSFTATNTITLYVGGTGGCVATPTCTPITITVNGLTANVGIDQKVSGSTTANISGNGSGSWSIIGTGDGNGYFDGVTGTLTSNNPSATFTGTAGQQYELRWTVTNAGCANNSDDIFITFLSQTTLGLGDIAFTGYNSDNPDEFRFVLLKEINAGTQITFTDRGWLSTGGFRGGENTIVYEFCRPYSCGDEFSVTSATAIKDEGGNDAATFVSGSIPALAFTGDQLFAYQGTAPTTGGASNWIAAIQMNGAWDANAVDAASSAKPSAFTDGVNSISISPQADNAKYNCSITTNSPANLRAAVNTASNWTTQEAILTLGFCSFSCGSCVEPVLTSVSAPATACPGQTVALTINGTLNGANEWAIYTGSCGGTLVGTTASSSFNVTPTTTTTYYVSGRGGCVVSESCQTATISVTSVQADAGPDQKLNGGSFTTLQANGGFGDGTWTFVDPGDGQGSVSDLNAPAATFQGTAGQSYTLKWTIDNSATACPNTEDEVTIVFLDQTGLTTGDIAFIAASSDDDDFAFVALKDINAGTSIKFTDRGWQSAGGFRVGEGTITVEFCRPYNCGDEFNVFDATQEIKDASGRIAGTLALTGQFDLSSSGDQLIAYQGAETNLLTAIQLDGPWETTGSIGTNESYLPTGLTDGTNAVSFGTHVDNAYLNCDSVGTGLPGPIINTATKWIRSNSFSATLPLNCDYTCCTPSVINSISGGSGGPFCPGTNLTLTVSGQLNDDQTWEWYTGSCGGTPFGTGISINPSPTVTTTYYVRGEGTCSGTSGACASFTVVIDDTVAPVVTCPADINVSNDAGLCSAVVNLAATVTDNCNAAISLNYSSNPAATLNIGYALAEVFATGGLLSGFAQDLTFGPDGNLYVAVETSPRRIISFDPTGSPLGDFVNPSDLGLFTPLEIAFGPDGNLYAPVSSNALNGDVRKFDGTTGTLLSAPPSGSISLYGMEFGPDGALYIAHNGGVVRFDIGTGVGTNFITDATLLIPFSLTFGPDGNIYIANPVAGDILRYDGTTGSFIDVFATNTAFALEILFGPDGNLYVSGAGIKRYNGTTGAFIDTAIPGAARGIAFGPDGSIYVGRDNNTRIERWKVVSSGTFPVGTTTVTATATDVFGNQSACNFDVTVTDAEAPNVICPASIPNVVLDGSGSGTLLANIGDGSSTDNCSALESSPERILTCSDVGPQTVLLTATDPNGNTASTNCSFNVVDNLNACCTPGVATSISGSPGPLCPQSTQTLTVNGSLNDDQSWVWYTGSCGGTQVATGTNFNVSPTVTTTYYVRAEGTCSGTSGACTEITITVEDNVPPSLSCPSDITVSNDPTLCIAVVSFAATASDNCGGNVDITYSQNSGTTFNVGTTTVDVTATDESGTQNMCSFKVTVNDTEAPTAVCPASIPDVELNLSGNGSLPGNIGGGNSFDNCNVVETSPTVNFTCDDVGIQTVTLTATDPVGNTASTTCSFNVVDNLSACNQAPVANCKNITVSTAPNTCEASITTAQVDDNSTDPDSDPLQLSLDNSGPFAPGTHTVELTVSDGSLSAKCTSMVTVEDNQAPTFSNCPGNISVNNDQGDCGAKVNWTPPTLSDNCPATAANSTHNPGDFFPVGSTTVTYTGSDAAGNPAIDCSFVVTVNDTENPTITCPADITVSNDAGNCSAVVNLPDPSLGDNCPNPTFTYSPITGSTFSVGTMVVTGTAKDAAGNTAQCTFNVTVNDTEDPVIACPGDITVNNDPGQCGAVVNYSVTYDDNCPGAGLVVEPATGSFFAVGTTSVLATAKDAAGRTAQCGFNVTVNDNEVPVFSNCPGTINVFNDAGECGALVNWTPPGLTDNCPGATSDSSHDPGDFFDVGTTTVTYSGSDAAGNDAVDCSFTVSVTDAEKPTISCPANISTGTDPGECGAEVSFSPAIANDNCAVDEIKARYRPVDENNNSIGSWTSRVLDPSGFFPVGRYQVQWRAEDIYGNKKTCSHFLDVYDDEDPVAVCKDVTVDFNGEEDINLTVSQVWNEAASSDNCGNVSYVGTSPGLSIDCDELGNTIALAVTIEDEAGNKDQCTSYVSVIGLPCGWAEGPQDGSLNCDGDTSSDYDPGEESFTLTADGCWHDCRESDRAAFVYQALCGDGQLTARLADINTSGYAGLMARESLDPDARRAGVLKNYSTRRVRREYRAAYGGIVSQRLSNRSRVEWLRIVREGNSIKSYTSTNGSSWRLLYKITFPGLEDCIYFGMTAYSLNGNAEVEAVFDNVSISSSGSLAGGFGDETTAPGQFLAYDIAGNISEGEVNIFPNPASHETQIVLNGFEDKPAQIVIRDQFGRLVRQLEVDSAVGLSETIAVNDLAAGIYLVSIIQDQQAVVSKKLVVQQ